MSEQENYTPAEVARKLRANISTVYRYILTGKLRSVRRGGRGHHLVPADALEEFLTPSAVERPGPTPSRTAMQRRHEKALETLRRNGVKV